MAGDNAATEGGGKGEGIPLSALQYAACCLRQWVQYSVLEIDVDPGQ